MIGWEWSVTASRRSFVVRKLFLSYHLIILKLNDSDGKEVKVVMQQTATGVDQVKVTTQQTASDVDQVKSLSSNLIIIDYGALHILSGNQLRERIHKWLSPPDPSTNHNIACGTYHKKAASWFFQGSIFQEWKSTGSLFWVHGKRWPCPFPTCLPLILSCIAAGSGKSVLWFVDS